MFRTLFMMLVVVGLYMWLVSSDSDKDLLSKGEEIYHYAKKKWKKWDIDWDIHGLWKR